MKNILPIAALLGGGFFLVNYLRRKAQAGENLKYELNDIKIDTAKTLESRLAKVFYDLKLNVANNGQASVNIKSIFFNIKINDINTGELKTGLNFTIPRESEKVITIKANVNTIGILLLIRKIIFDGLQAKINLDGYIVTDLGTVNINFEKDFTEALGAPAKKKVSF